MSTDDDHDLGYTGVSYEPPGDLTPASRAAAVNSAVGAPVATASSVGAAAVAIDASEMAPEANESDSDHDEPTSSDPASAVLTDSEPADEEEAEDKSSTARDLFEWAAVLVAAVGLALIFKAFLFQAFWIPSESMESTLQLQDRVLVNKVSYRLHDINRGDVVVFRRPDLDPDDEVKDLIKRVIAVEGEVVEGIDGVVYIDGDRLLESYLDEGVTSTSFDFGPIIVAPDTVFVMGDNRERSYDSRYFGTIPVGDVKGRAFVVFWPLNRLGGL